MPANVIPREKLMEILRNARNQPFGYRIQTEFPSAVQEDILEILASYKDSGDSTFNDLQVLIPPVDDDGDPDALPNEVWIAKEDYV